MSQYISFYIRNKDEFIELDSYCRSNTIFQVLKDYSPYEKISPLTKEKIQAGLDTISDDIKMFKHKIEYNKQQMNLIKDFNNSVDDKNLAISDLLELNSELEEEIEYRYHTRSILFFFQGMLENYRYSENYDQSIPFLYVGIETGPNPTLEDIEEGSNKI